MERDDKVNRVTECNCAFPSLWFLSYLSLYKNTFNGSLDFIVPTKRSLYSKRAPLGLTKKNHMVLFFPAQRLFMHLLQNCRARRNRTPLRSCSVKTRTLILKGCQGLRERGGAVSWELFTLSQMISSLERMDCNIESITGCCCRGAFVWVAVEQDGRAPHKGEDYYCFTTEDPWVD